MPSLRRRFRPAPKPDTEVLLAAMRRAGIDAETTERICRVLVETTEQEQAAWDAANLARPKTLSEITAAKELMSLLRRYRHKARMVDRQEIVGLPGIEQPK